MGYVHCIKEVSKIRIREIRQLSSKERTTLFKKLCYALLTILYFTG